jgi:hypothetical protein
MLAYFVPLKRAVRASDKPIAKQWRFRAPLFSCYFYLSAVIIRRMKNLLRFTLSLCLLAALAVPAFAQNAQPVQCPLHAGSTLASITASGATQIIAIPTQVAPPIFINGTATVNPAKPRIAICAVQIMVQQAGTAADYGLVTGTGTNCATGQVNLTPQWFGTASVKETRDFLNGGTAPLVTPPGTAVCLKLSNAPTGAKILIFYNVIV